MLLRSFRKFVSVWCVLSLVVVSSVIPVRGLLAQDVQDFNPLVIQHAEVAEGIAGDIQPFDVVVFGDAEIVSVTFLHREAGEPEFEKTEMVLREKDGYRVFLPTDANKEVTIEYYFEALDKGGTKTISGFPKYFERKVIVPLEAAPESASNPEIVQAPQPEEDVAEEVVVEEVTDSDTTASTSAASTSTGAEQGEKKNNKLWLILGGVAAAAAVGVLLGSDPDPGDPSGPETRTLTLVPPASQ